MPEINQYGQVVNDVVADWQGARILKRTPLSGRFCRLEPLEVQRHAADLFAAYALGDESDWTWLASTCPASVEATTHWVAGKVNDDALVPFAVIDLQTERAVGWSAIWLLLKNAFGQGYRRLEWKCDSMNIASRRAAERLGFTWEGCLRQKMVRKGRTRDSDQLSIIDSEWAARDAALRAWLAAENFDSEGRQLKRLEDFR